MQCNLVLCLLYSVCMFLSASQSQYKTPLHFLSLLPYPDNEQPDSEQPSWDEGPTLYLAEQLAVDHINQRNDILTNYSLSLVAGDSGCELERKAFLAFVEYIVHGNEKHITGVIGPGCSMAAAAISPLMWRNGIDLINIHIAGSLTLGDRKRYSNSFGTLGSTEAFVNASLALIARNQWSQIATLYDQERLYFYSTLQEFESRLANQSNTKLQYSAAVFDKFLPLKIIKQQHIRIIFLLVGPDLFRKLLCLAYHMGMYFPLYQWVIISRTAEDIKSTSFWYAGEVYTCDAKEVALAANKSIIINFQLIAQNTSDSTDVGISYDSFSEQYTQRVHKFNEDKAPEEYINSSVWAIPAYDAVWALALGFNNSLEELKQRNLSFDSYTRGNAEITSIIKQSILNIKFHGLSGLIDFKQSDGFTSRNIQFYQIYNGRSFHVASFSNGIITDMNNPPAEYLESNFEDIYIPAVMGGIAAVVLLTIILAFVLTLTLNVLVFIYAKSKTVKAASPTLLYIAFGGCYVIILAEVILTVTSATVKYPDTNCLLDYIWRGIVHIGVTLILSIVMLRAWRLYRIFRYYTNPGHLLSNRALVCIVSALVLVDIVVLVIWVRADPLKPSITSNIVRSSHPYIANHVVCTQNYPLAWFGSLLGYNYMLMFTALWVTLNSRHITIKPFRTHSLSLLVYMVSLVTGVGFPLYAVLSITENYIAEFVTLASVLVIVVYLTIFLLFLPPLIPLIRNKSPFRITLMSSS